MLVSVIVPNYNHGSYLEQRIESILNQSFQDFELIILDDFSSDNSIDIIQKYKNNEKVSHIICNEKNSGSPFAQWEKGIRLAQGKWIWIAESDDVADPKFLEELIQVGDDVVISYSASVVIDKNGVGSKRYTPSRKITNCDWSSDFLVDGLEEIKQQLFFECSIPNASAVLFKRNIVDFKIFEEMKNMRFAGDWMFWLEQAGKGKIYYSSSPLNYFRWHPSATRNDMSKDLEIIRFKEYFMVLNFAKQKYRLKWNPKKHLWIIDEFVNKYLYVNLPSESSNWFPISYKVISFFKIMRIKYFSK